MTTSQKLIVWDLNGTLIDDLSLNVRCFNLVMQKYSKPLIDAARYQEIFEIPIKNMYCRSGFSETEFDTSAPDLQNTYHDAYEAGIVEVGFRAGAAEVLPQTQGTARHLILSNHLVSSIQRHLERLNASHLIPDILAHQTRAEQIGWQPKGERLAEFLNRLKIGAQDGIIIGDTPEEVEIARNYGMISICITGGFATEERLKAARPNHLIRSLSELHPILRAEGFLS